jgi:hypothetical protein
MEMGQEDIEAVVPLTAMLAQNTVAELAYTRSEIAQNILIAASDNLDAARIAAIGAAQRKG